MFKFSLPMKLIISSGSFLTLIALACLIVMSTSAQTSDVLENRIEDLGSASTAALQEEPAETTTAVNEQQQRPGAGQATRQQQQHMSNSSRHRSGRLYSPQSGAGQQSTPLDSYAAAYAAANSADQGAGHLTQQSVGSPVNAADTSAYTSFGEVPPASQSGSAGSSSAASLASIARQLSSQNEYSSQPNYFANYMSPSSNEVSYSSSSSQPASSYYAAPSSPQFQHHHHQHAYKAQQQSPLPLGYPTNLYERGYNPMSSNYYDRVAHSSAASSPFWTTSSFGSGLGGGGLMSSASHALSHWTNGFSISEIICGLVAIAIGAIILGAPFFLIYLALMGNFSGSGTLSLTNPTSAAGAAGGAAAPANGRRKRLAVFEAMNMGEQASGKHPDLAAWVDSIAKTLSPHVDLQQLSRTFKQLVSSIDKYSPSAREEQVKGAKQRSS